jgi:ribosomal protein S18 acetylase RimI-like enzyme
VIIRLARETDYAALAHLWFDSWQSIGISNDTDLTRDELVARFYSELSRWCLFAASVGDRPVGLLAIVPEESWLDQLFVAPEAQGGGVGRALLQQARSEMPDGFWLWSAVDNQRACRWYEREGFTETEREFNVKHRRERVRYTWEPATTPSHPH